jgi:hypothetical protein
MFGIGATAETISMLRLLGIAPLVVGLAAFFVFRENKGLIAVVATVTYVLYQVGIAVFLYQSP